MSQFLGVTAYARHLGVSLTAVQHAIKTGRIQKGADGLIDVEKADIDFEANRRRPGRKAKPHADTEQPDRPHPKKSQELLNAEAAKKKATWAAKHKAEAPTIHVEASAAGPAQTVTPTYNESRSAKEFYDAEIKRMEMETKKGKLIEAEKVRKDAFECYRVYRDAMLNIPDRVASQIATETDPRVVHDILTGEIRKTLEAFAEEGRAA